MTNMLHDYPELMSASGRPVDDEPMAEFRLLQMWQFRVAKNDAMLILQALGGRLTSPDAIAAARELGDRLTALRIKETSDVVEHMDVLRARLETATGKTVDEIVKAPRAKADA